MDIMKQGPPESDEVKRDRLFGLVFREGKNKLYKQDLNMKEYGKPIQNPIATWMSADSAAIDSRAYEILKKECGANTHKLNSYLRAILDFEINHSDNPQRHNELLPIEEEIFVLLEKNGYKAR